MKLFKTTRARYKTVQNLHDLQHMVTLYPEAPQHIEHQHKPQRKTHQTREKIQVDDFLEMEGIKNLCIYNYDQYDLFNKKLSKIICPHVREEEYAW